jgi:penicillin-binding protein 1C
MEVNNTSFESIPMHNPNCEKIFREGKPNITSPVNGTEYLISKKNPEPQQLVCETGNDVSRVYWYINNRFYKSADVGSKQFFIPNEGVNKISCTDDKGRNSDIQIKVSFVDL